jgi:translation elongation factor EF-1beta
MSIPFELTTAFATAAVATSIAALLSKSILPTLLEQKDRREKKRTKLKEQIKKKIDNKIDLEANEIADIGRGFGLSAGNAMDVLYQLYSEAEDGESHSRYKKLLLEINRTEPFESLPEEVRPSLARLSEISHLTNQESDKELLHPITKVLEEYQEMKRDHATMRKQNKISYIVALISFFVGVVGLVLAFTGPSKEFIQEQIQKSTQQIQDEIHNAQQGAQAGRR